MGQGTCDTPHPEGIEWYVYYNVRTENAVRLCERVAALQAHLCEQYKVGGALKRRPQEQDGKQTWMEVYTETPENFDSILAAAVARADLQELIDGTRHHEQFSPVVVSARVPPHGLICTDDSPTMANE
jgi:hypothetical protein